MNRRQLEAQMEPFGDSVTRIVYGKKRIYGGGGGGSTPTSSTTTQTIPDELKPLANLYTKQATDYANTPYQAYTGQRYADLNQTQNQGLDMATNRALNGSNTMNNAEGALNGFIQGGQTNPYLDSMVSKAQSSVANQFNTMTKPQTETAMRNSGSFGNSGLNELMQNQQKTATTQMSDIANQMYGQAYGQDQSNKMQAIGMSPTFGNAAYNDASQLMNAGNMKYQQEQNPLDFQYQQFNEAKNYPLQQMSATSGVLGSRMGTSTQGTTATSGK